MDVHPGVFVSHVATEKDWEPDPEVGGDAEAHVLFDMTGDGRALGGTLARYRDRRPAPLDPSVKGGPPRARARFRSRLPTAPPSS